MDAGYRYRAFISYSHRDRGSAAKLHRALESYRMPRKLVGLPGPLGPVPPRLTPIFRDRDELPASSDLGEQLTAALAASRVLVVLCSPAAAKSRWVNEEVLTFKRVHGEARVLAIVVAGEPEASSIPGREDEECFPHALRYRLGDDGKLTDVPAVPIAADLRPSADGERLALLKLIAGMTGLRLDDLVQREAQRRIRRLTVVAAASMGAVVVTAGLAVYANARRLEANEQRRVAERESAVARATSDFLVGTFQLANPAVENPRNITALTILSRAADRARTELSREPAVRVRLLDTVGQAYNNLGLLREARETLEPGRAEFAAAGPDGAEALLTLGTTFAIQSNFDAAGAAIREAESLLGPDSSAYAETRGRAAELRARVEHNGGSLATALAAYDQALAYYRAMPEPKPEILARALNNRGLVLADMGRFDDARGSMLKANELYRSVGGDGDRRVGQSYFALAQNALIAGSLAEADDYIGRSLAILTRVLEPNNPILGDSLSLQGQIFQGEKRLEESRRALRQAVDVYQRAFNGPHYLTGIAEVYLALVESELGHTDRALRYLVEAKSNYDASYGKLNANHGDLLVNRAVILARAHRLAEAHHDCEAGLEILRQTSGADSSFYKSNVDICAKLN